MAIPGQEAVVRFQENEERFDTFLNINGYYIDKFNNPVETLPHLVETVAQMTLTIDEKGNWATLTNYIRNDVVKQNNINYICVINHNSGTFATDLAANKWKVYNQILAEDLKKMVINPISNGAYGDGINDDTSIFTAIEMLFKDIEIDLLGKTYLVEKIFTGNRYKNGTFKYFVLTTPYYFQMGKIDSSIESSNAQKGSDLILKAKYNDTRYAIVDDGLYDSIILLGDSISHGAFQGNLYKDGWVNILKRMINAEFGSTGYGFCPLNPLGSGPSLSQEVHNVSSTGTWTTIQSTTGGEEIIQGIAYVSSTPGSTFKTSVPTFQKNVRIWYVEKIGSGVFSYSINGGSATNVDTNAISENYAKSIVIPMTDNGAGLHELVLTVVSGEVTICGFGYENPLASPKAGNILHNFSQSGRRLHPATERMIDKCCQGAVLILALGFNDYGDCAINSTYNTEFQQRIDWIIKYCLKYNTTLIVVNMCWWADRGNPAIVGLKRASVETRGIYIPLPEYLTRNQYLKTDFGSAFYLQTTLKMWTVDDAHPNAFGAKWIAETVAKAIGLSCSSKAQALAFHDYQWPMQFEPASAFKNTFTQQPYLSNIRRNGNSLNYSILVSTKTGSNLPIGSNYSLNIATSVALSRQNAMYNCSNMNLPACLHLGAGGAVSSAFTITLDNIIKINCYVSDSITFKHAFTTSFDTGVENA